MTKFFIRRFQWVTENNKQVKKIAIYPCKSNLLPTHRLIKNERV